MYAEKVGTSPIKQPEHLSIAEKMGQEITSSFNPDEQNEMLRTIRNMISERRQLEIEETEKKLAYLKDSFQQLS